MILQSTKEAILETIDVEDVLFHLKLDGKSNRDDYWACCPFHKERSPSFRVVVRGPNKATWTCFGCHKERELGGGIIPLVAVLLNFRDTLRFADNENPLDFEQAWRWLGIKAGISTCPLTAARAGHVSGRIFPPKFIKSLDEIRLKFPSTMISANDSPEAKEYLLTRVTQIQLDRTEFGWLPDRRRVIIPTMVLGKLVNWDARAIEKICTNCKQYISIVKVGKSRICPHCQGTLIEMSPKTYGASEKIGAKPKYSLFNHDWISIRAKQVIVTEGPFGALHVEQATGFATCALRGSVMHNQQAELLSRWPLIIVMPDGDEAGQKLKSNLSYLMGKTEVKVVSLEKNVQPDDLSVQELNELIKNAERPHIFPTPTFTIQKLRTKS